MLMYLKRIILSVAFILITTLMCTNKMNCFNVYLDDDGYACIEMADHKKNSPIHYKTLGFTISRCVYNPCAKQLHSSHEWVEANFANIEPASSSNLSGDVFYNT